MIGPQFLSTHKRASNARSRLHRYTHENGNAATAPTEKLRCDTLDAFYILLNEMSLRTRDDIAMWKADIDAAYRRAPIKKAHHELSAITFKQRGVPIMSVHRSLPFGSVASVHGWDRIGESVQHPCSGACLY